MSRQRQRPPEHRAQETAGQLLGQQREYEEDNRNVDGQSNADDELDDALLKAEGAINFPEEYARLKRKVRRVRQSNG